MTTTQVHYTHMKRRATDYPIMVGPNGKPLIERRSSDRDDDVTVVKLMTGDYFVTDQPHHMLMTILGSCVSACMRDPITRIGGMNHFLLPGDGGDDSESTRYGVYAMEKLINDIVKLGGTKSRLEVKVFGGGNVTNNSALIGSRNAEFVRHYLENERLPIVSEDLGDTYPRRLRYYPDTGKVMMMKLRRKSDYEVVKEEADFVKTFKSTPHENDIELF